MHDNIDNNLLDAVHAGQVAPGLDTPASLLCSRVTQQIVSPEKNTLFTKYSSWKSSCLLNKRNIRKLFLSISNKDKSSGKLLRLLFRLHNSLFLLNPCVQVSICPAPGL